VRRRRIFSPRFVAAITAAGWALSSAASAFAAHPAYPVVFSGPSVHHRYTVELDTGCAAGTSGCVPSPTYLGVSVVTPHRVGKCAANSQYSFPSATLQKNGSFSAKQAYAGGITMTVSGRFTSARSAHGTVSATGCQAASFTITLPKPTVPTPPPGQTACYWLDQAHATQTLGKSSKPVGNTGVTYDPVTGLGRCIEWTHKASSTYYGAYTYVIIVGADPPVTGEGSFAKKLPGFGPGAVTVPNAFSNTIYFKVHSAWVELNYTIESANNPPASKIKQQGVALLKVAKRIYRLMR